MPHGKIVRAFVFALCVGACAIGSWGQSTLHQRTKAADILDGSVNPCQPLNDTDKAKIVAYVSKRLNVPQTETLTIVSDEEVPGTCYRELSIKGNTPQTFFLSPDQRFLSRVVFDLDIDPALDRKREQDGITSVLAEGSPSRGSRTAAVTIVEFGDFECLYCKRFHEWAQSLAGADFRLVFKHLPLQGHPWAHDASAFAVCAEMQSEDGFWRLHDFFYNNQATLTAENLESRVAQDFADPAFDSARLLNCVHNHQADARIARDMQLASQLGINATPTLFVNGVRGGDLRTIEQLIRATPASLKVETEKKGDVNAQPK
jgi:protein-disulfide isomerase